MYFFKVFIVFVGFLFMVMLLLYILNEIFKSFFLEYFCKCLFINYYKKNILYFIFYKIYVIKLI